MVFIIYTTSLVKPVYRSPAFTKESVKRKHLVSKEFSRLILQLSI